MAPAIFSRQNDGTVEQTDDNTNYSPVMANMVTAIIVLMLFGFFVTCSMFILRARRRRLAALRMAQEVERQQFAHRGPMMQKNMSLCAPARPSHHRRTKSLTTPPDSPTFIVGETDSLMDEKRWEAEHGGHGARQPENVPQIHLTFPEELDEKTGRRESKVVVVTVSEKGSVGLSPFQQGEAPPAYSDRKDMQSLDLDRIGGLKENKN